MSNTTYYQKSRDVILNRAKDYYEDDKNMEETHTMICLKKRLQNYRETKKSK